MKKRTPISFVVAMAALAAAGPLEGGPPTPPGGPNTASGAQFTLGDIYNRLNAGTTGAKRGATFAEPTVAPGTGTMFTTDQVMAMAPAVDTTNGATPADVANGKTFWGLRTDGGSPKNGWGPQVGTYVPSAGIAGLPRTGQTPTLPVSPAPAGSDGALQKGVPWPIPRFTDNLNGTVTDNLTKLIWVKNPTCTDTNGLEHNAGTWANALTVAAALANGACGLTDGSTPGQWRVPNRWEMESLLHLGYWDPALPNSAGTGKWSAGDPFTNLPVGTSSFWTSSTCVPCEIIPPSQPHAWTVNVSGGHVTYFPKSSVLLFWPVRDGQ